MVYFQNAINIFRNALMCPFAINDAAFCNSSCRVCRSLIFARGWRAGGLQHFLSKVSI